MPEKLNAWDVLQLKSEPGQPIGQLFSSSEYGYISYLPFDNENHLLLYDFRDMSNPKLLYNFHKIAKNINSDEVEIWDSSKWIKDND